MFYTLHQRIDEDGSSEADPQAGIGQYLIVEAKSAQQAFDIAKLIGIRDLSRWTRIENLFADQVPSIADTPIDQVEFGPEEVAHDELDQALAYIHYLDGRVDRVGFEIRLGITPHREAADHELVAVGEPGGVRDWVSCGVCDAQFTVPRGTDTSKLVINGCRGSGQGHPDGCECPGCELL